MFNPEGVIGAAAWTREFGLNARTSENPSRRQEITLACFAARCFNGAPPLGIVVHPSTRLPKEKNRPHTPLPHDIP